MYESLEKMRKLNLEIACEENGIIYLDDHSMQQRCTTCLLEGTTSPKVSKTSNPRFPRLRKFVDQQTKNAHVVAQSFQKATPCLICGSPVCSSHSSKSFRQEKITVCNDCERLFTTDYIIECLTAPSPDERRFLTDGMLSIYDRTLLLLKYSSQFITPVAESLEKMTEKSNRVSVGSSGAGVVSGMLGMCAAATILTPMGPPLLVASLLFGGSATAVQTGSELRNYYSEPNQLADRIIALHGMICSILRVTQTLQDVITRDHMESGFYENPSEDLLSTLDQEDEKKFGTRAMLGITAGRAAAASVELGALAGAGVAGTSLTTVAETAAVNAGILNRSGMALLRTARVARFAGGALSAATLALEAKSLNNTLNEIRDGNPCDKADILREINEEMNQLPTTTEVDEAIERYLGIMALRRKIMSEEEARSALIRLRAQVDSNENSLLFVTEDDEQDEKNSEAAVKRDHFSKQDASTGALQDGKEEDKPLQESTKRPPWALYKEAVAIVGNGLGTSWRGGTMALVKLPSAKTDQPGNRPTAVSDSRISSPAAGRLFKNDSESHFDENLTA
jgi:hypothetical protein